MRRAAVLPRRLAVVISRGVGLWHVRGGPLAALVVAIALVITVVFPDLNLAVGTAFENPPRGVGTPELVAIVLASILPALTVPAFAGREVLAPPAARAAHLLFTLAVTAAPLLVLPLWSATVTARFPGTEVPSVTGLVGTVLVFCCLASSLCLVVGGAFSAVLTPVAFTAFLVAQQAFPGSFLTSWLATGSVWHTNWWVTAASAALLLTLAWRLRCVPLPARP